MAKLDDLVAWMDEELEIARIPDYGPAMNGLQLENGGAVTRVAAAVDASLPVFEKAVAAGADLLIVHHGMFWQGARAVTGAQYRKLKLAMEAGMAVYSAHIPLDVHPLLGNNAILARELGLEVTGGFFDYKGIELGLLAEDERSLGELAEDLERVVEGPVLRRGEAAAPAGLVGVITGGAGSEVEKVAAAGVRTFITGEGPHWSFPLAEELDLQLLYAGHYATETFGVRALAAQLAGKFGLDETFVSHPSGL
ncbi:MAG: Nif3-like dinuclear metal center hexameric protein [Verrucomicrobiales bacterium]